MTIDFYEQAYCSIAIRSISFESYESTDKRLEMVAKRAEQLGA